MSAKLQRSAMFIVIAVEISKLRRSGMFLLQTEFGGMLATDVPAHLSPFRT
jgi:hypothetical protein